MWGTLVGRLTLKTATQRALALSRVMRPTRRRNRPPIDPGAPAGAALQVFLSRVDAFLGTELFGTDTPVTIGRHIDAVLRLDDDTISRLHCRLILEGDSIYVEDLASANGTLVNRQRIEGRVEVLPSDAIHIGAFTLKVRPLIPRGPRVIPSDEISEKSTRREAILTADSSKGTDEAAIDFRSGVDWKLYEAAVRRATGTEAAASPVNLAVVADPPMRGPTPTGPMDETGESDRVERERTVHDGVEEEFVQEVSVEKPVEELDPWIDARIAELDRIVDRIERPDRESPVTSAERAQNPLAPPPTPPPSRITDEVFETSTVAQMGPDTFARYLANQLNSAAATVEDYVQTETPKRTVRGGFSVVPTESMPEEESTEAELDGPPKPAAAQEVEVEIELEPPRVFARRVPAGSKISVPPAIIPTRPASIAPSTSGTIRTPSAAHVPRPPPLPHMRKAAKSTVAPLPKRRATLVSADVQRAATLETPKRMRRRIAESAITSPDALPRQSTHDLPPPPVAKPRRVRGRATIRGAGIAADSIKTPKKGIAERVRETLQAPSSGLPVRGASADSVARRVRELNDAPAVVRSEVAKSVARRIRELNDAPVRSDAAQSVTRPVPELNDTPAIVRTPPTLETPRARPTVTPTPRPELVLTPAAQPAIRSVRVKAPIPARLVTPTAMRISVAPVAAGAELEHGVRPSQVGSAVHVETDLVRPRRPSEDSWDDRPVRRPGPTTGTNFDPHSWDGIEIAARTGTRLLDIATLRANGEQYVLGHKTPQGVRAPHLVHPGLRLLRIGPNREVDLVFPGDAAGHLVRDSETVMFTELGHGRKYSCLRLTAGDVATVILNDGTDEIAYHVRFLRRPKL